MLTVKGMDYLGGEYGQQVLYACLWLLGVGNNLKFEIDIVNLVT